MRTTARAIGKGRLLWAATGLVLFGCSGGSGPDTSPADAWIAEAQPLSPEKIEAKANEISQNDYRMLRALMIAGGLDTELGGGTQGDAALKGLMLSFQKQLGSVRADLPRVLKIADGTEAAGLLGLGASFVVGLTTADAMIDLSNQAKAPTGEFGGERGGGSFKSSFTEGQVSTESTFTDTIGGLKGTITTKLTLDTCPRADGAIKIDFLSDATLTKPGTTATAKVKTTAQATWYVNDDAEFGNDVEATVNVESATSGGSRGTAVGNMNYTQRSSSAAPSTDSGVVTRSSSDATEADVDAAKQTAESARTLVLLAARNAENRFKSGQCVTLAPTTDPTKRSGAKPKTSFAIFAAPRSKIDGTPTKGSVTATLTGAGSLDPASSKIPADAKFTYVAGEKDTKGSVAFEARSKRGIGKATLAFDTMNRAYLVNGGSPPMVVSGKACNLAEPFTLTNSTFKMDLMPSSETGGSYTWTGSYMGFGARGNGSYTVDLTDQGGSISVNGRGYAGSKSGTAVGRTFTLTPTDPC